MIRAKISTVKNDLSRLLKLVEKGEEIEVLHRDRPVARIVGIRGRDKASAPSRVQQMAKDGLVHPGTGELSSLLLTKPPGKGAGVLEAVLEEREGR